MSVLARALSRASAPAHRLSSTARTFRRAAVAALVALGVVATALVVQLPAGASTLDAQSYPLSFTQAARSAVSPAGATGATAGDVMKYAGVTTIDGTVVDAIVTTVSLESATIAKYDEGSAVATPPAGSTRAVDTYFMPNLHSNGNPGAVTFSFTFYEGGTYTGPGTGVPVTLANVKVNTYDIDANGSARQFNEFRGFQTYLTYSQDATHGLDVTSTGNGFARFVARAAVMSDATSGAYSWARAQVTYDRVDTLSVKLGQLGSGVAYFALDFSVGGIWSTNGTTIVTPVQSNNPANRAPVTADVDIFATRNAASPLYVSDFPYTDADANAFAGVRVVTAPDAATGRLERFDGTSWVPVANGTFLTATDLEKGFVRVVPTAGSTSFTFAVNDGLVDSAPATFRVTAPLGAQTIDFPNPGTKSGTAAQTFPSGATASSGLTPVLTSATPGVCTVSGTDITVLALPAGVNAATCVITATQPGDASYGRAEPVTQEFQVVRKAEQTIAFADPADRAFDTADIASGATASSGLPVTLTSGTPDVCTVSGGTIRPVAAGDCTVTASQPGNGSYLPAAPVTQTFTLGMLPQEIGFAQPTADELAHGTRDLAVTTTSGLASVLVSTTPDVCTVSGTTVTYLATGVCTITASQPGDGVYRPAVDVTRSFSVIKTPQVITFAPIPTHARVDGAGLAATVAIDPTTDAAGLAVTTTSSTPEVCTVSGTTVTLVGAGVCRLTAAQDGDATRAAAVPVTVAFRVFEITTTSLAAGVVGTAYTTPLEVTGGTALGTWSTATPLPAGLTLDPATGVISGTPTVAFDGPVTIRYEEDGAFQEVELHLVVTAELPTLAEPGTPAAVVGAALAYTGQNPVPAALVALSTLLAGAVALVVARRRRAGARHRA